MASAASCFHALSTPAARSSSLSSRLQQAPILKPNQVIIIRSQKREETPDASISRRLALTVLIGGAAAVGTKVSPADAAYGEAANVFGKQKSTEFTQYAGPGFKLSVPAKWNPSKEVEYPGQVLRYEDNFDTTSNLAVMVTPTDKKTISDYGAPEDFLSKVDYLLGKQAYFGKTASEYASRLNYKILCNTTFTISNVVGPKEKLTFAGHPVDYIKTTSSSLPHAITMHMVSYAGTAYMQILVAKDLVHDPEVLAKCLEDAMLEMKEAALPKIKRK